MQVTVKCTELAQY